MPNTRDESFVPLTPASVPSARRADFRVTILSQAENTQPFRPLTPSAPGTAAAPGAGSEPRVSVQRDGDRVSAIHIQCGCGQTMELACVYEAPPPKPS